MEFEITSSPASTILFAGTIAAITLSIGGLFAWFAFTTSSLSASIDHALPGRIASAEPSLNIKVPIYGRSIPISRLDFSSATIVNLNTSPTLYPVKRTNGIGMPGYAVGWFRLKNGEKALTAVTARDKVVYLRTLDGYSLLLSLVDPQSFIDRLSTID